MRITLRSIFFTGCELLGKGISSAETDFLEGESNQEFSINIAPLTGLREETEKSEWGSRTTGGLISLLFRIADEIN